MAQQEMQTMTDQYKLSSIIVEPSNYPASDDCLWRLCEVADYCTRHDGARTETSHSTYTVESRSVSVAIASALHYINKAEFGEQSKLWTHCKCGQASPGVLQASRQSGESSSKLAHSTL